MAEWRQLLAQKRQDELKAEILHPEVHGKDDEYHCIH